MRWIGSLIVAFSMYSRIPMPQISWTDGHMRYAMCFFPAIGLVIGGIYLALGAAAEFLGLPGTARVCLGALIPLAVTGGIHMDGYLDTADARCSFGDREKKLEILKDPHTGAFAVIRCSMYLLAFGAAFSLIPDGSLGVTAGIFTLSRALSAWAVVSFPKAKKDGLAASFSRTAAERTVRGTSALWGILGVCLMAAACGPLMAAACTLAAALAFVCYRRMALAEFGGITGDLAGYFLQRAELWQLMAAAAVCAVRPIL